jgi:hypothetical protein
MTLDDRAHSTGAPSSAPNRSTVGPGGPGAWIRELCLGIRLTAAGGPRRLGKDPPSPLPGWRYCCRRVHTEHPVRPYRARQRPPAVKRHVGDLGAAVGILLPMASSPPRCALAATAGTAG